MRVVRIWVGAAVAAAALPLAGCDHVPDAVNPVAWYRDASGASQSDVEDANQRNEANLEAGSKEPYPNLASVPNVPSSATSTKDRQKLVDSLIADRANAKYNNEQLQAGQVASIAPPPAPLKLGPPGSSPTTAVSPPQSSPPHAAAPTPVTSAPIAPVAPAASANTREAAPMESTLTSPTIPTAPKGQVPLPPPPPATVTHTPPPAAPAVAAAEPNAPPTAPKLTAPPAAAPAGVREGGRPALAMRTPAKAQNVISVSLGDVAFAPGSASLPEAQRSALTEIAGLYRQTHGQIRVVGHAEPGHGTDAAQQRIAGLDLALDRANAVAQALSKLGVPATDIRIEAAPASTEARSRAEVFMEY
ncbi:MAG: OmpA family protein [Alphaproteobacteria bacterium]|nr:OmpA family protein [Alphaproteobacteria bacterium]